MVGRRGIVGIVVVAALAACFVDEGTPGATAPTSMSGSGTTGGGGESDGTTGESGGSTAPGTSSDTSGDVTMTATTTTATSTTTTSTASDPSGPTTDDPACVAPGQACDFDTPCCGCGQCIAGICVADDAKCGECQICGADASCSPAPEKSPCGPSFDCSLIVYGLENGICRAFTGMIVGRCDAGGECLDPNIFECQPGAILVECPECLRGDHNCTLGAFVDSITVSSVCHTNEQVSGCEDQCDPGGLSAEIEHFQCDNNGQCVDDGQTDCGNYDCDVGANVCYESCSSDVQCIGNLTCKAGVCAQG